MEASHAPHIPTHGLITGPQAPLPAGEAVLIGLAALAVVLIPFLWPLVEHFNAMAHEGAHAAVATLMGFSVSSVEVTLANKGGTSHNGPNGGLRRILTSFVGYVGPSAFGVGAAKLISLGDGLEVLWLAVVLLTLLLFLIHKSFGIVSVPVAIAALVLIIRNDHARTELIAAYAMTWLLLLSGIRVAVNHGSSATDADNLNKMTHLPHMFWAAAWFTGTVAALMYGGSLLVMRLAGRRPGTSA